MLGGQVQTEKADLLKELQYAQEERARELQCAQEERARVSRERVQQAEAFDKERSHWEHEKTQCKKEAEGWQDRKRKLEAELLEESMNLADMNAAMEALEAERAQQDAAVMEVKGGELLIATLMLYPSKSRLQRH